MKQTFMGLAVIATALAAAAFTTPKEEKAFTDYYFRVDASGNTLNSPTVPPTTNYSECNNSGTVYCSRSYGGYQLVSGEYVPLGGAGPIIKKK